MKLDLLGQKFGDLTVVKKTDRKWNSYDIWECACICGKKITSSSYYLLKGKSKNCGVKNHLLAGKKFGKLLVIKREKNKKFPSWLCKCDCGKLFIAETRGLISHRTKSCGCDLRPHLEDQRFGKLTVIKEMTKRNGRSVIWECLCDCGKTVFPNTSRLLRGRAKSCGSCTKNDLTGQRFGKLITIKYSGQKKKTDKIWECQCDCGKKVQVRSTFLKNGTTKSCGCKRIIYQDSTIVAKKRLFHIYLMSAKSGNRKFELTFEEFIQLTSGKCYYCGSSPKNAIMLGPSKYIYNGIDRIDNSLGYTKENSVSCCAFCNMSKGNLSQKNFLVRFMQLYNNVKNWKIDG